MAKRDMAEKAVPKLYECEVLMEYALAQGKKLPNDLMRSLQAERKKVWSAQQSGEDMQRASDSTVLSSTYATLVQSIAPASPSAVLLMDEAKTSWLRFLGPIPLVRKMMIMTLLSLAIFLGLFLSPMVDSVSINEDILSFSDPVKFLLNELVIVSIAALGASFYGLFEAYKFISNTSFDEKYESIYWIRFVLGIVSGVILAQFIFISGVDPNAIVSTATDGQKAPVATLDFITYKPLLAFLGGFSARVVHKILNSLVDSVETFVSGSARDAIRAREEAANAQIQEKVNTIKRDASNKEQANRLQATLQLMDLQQKLAKGEMDTKKMEGQLQQMIDQLVMGLGGTPTPGVSSYTTPQNQVITPNTEVNPYEGGDVVLPEDNVYVNPTDVNDPFAGANTVFPGDMTKNPDLNIGGDDLDQK